MRIFVTGASGFIGSALCAQLLARGHDVCALVRRPGSEPPGTRAVAGELSDGSRLSESLAAERPDCVIHLAAEIASQRSAEKIHAVNVEGTSRLIDACLALAGPNPTSGPRFVFASTVVTGDAHGALLTEETPLPVETPYGRSKQEGERLVLDCGLPAVVIRPSHVYGPGGWYAQELVTRLRQPGRFAVIGAGTNLWDVVHVDDVALALMLAAERGDATERTGATERGDATDQTGATGRGDATERGDAGPRGDAGARGDAGPRGDAGAIYHVVDDTPIAYYDFMALTARSLGVGPPRRIPVAVARLVAGSAAVAAVVRSARSSNAKIKRELSWAPRFPSAQVGIPDAVGRLGSS